MRRTGRVAGLVIAAGLLVSSVASGYYHFVHFATRVGPYIPIPEKYDLSALRNKTIYYYISDQTPTALAPGDTVQGLLSQIRLAAKAWNDVPTSDLRIAFGGVEIVGTPQNTPGIDVIFDDDIPPGIQALGGVTTIGAMIQPAGGTAFYPIARGQLKIRRDLSGTPPTPSFGERLFLTMTHEFGHTLGLQHTLTSGAMSTEITRATTRSKPLADDDVAGLSILYPSISFLAKTATLNGRVTMGGTGVNLASVVAISANGSAISSLTNPDGTYSVQGIPPGTYYVYVHPLPPALNGETTPANIKPPQDPNGTALPMSGYFTTQFYPGTRDPNAAVTIFLSAGDTKSAIDFSVQRRNSPALSSIVVYGYYGQIANYPAPVLGAGTGSTLVARGEGLVSASNALPAGLNIDVLAQSGATVRAGSAKYYSNPYMQFFVGPGFAWTPGPRHLLFWTQDDLYVLPSGLLLVSNQGPMISAVSTATDDKGGRAVLVAGSNFDATTRVFFDGAQAPVLRQNGDGSLLVSPPAALPGHRANVVAVNGDGQSSLFTQPGGGPTYTYDAGDEPSLTSISPALLPVGAEAMVEINGVNTRFADGSTVVGFGSSDITVRQVWVTGPNRLLANVSVAAGAALAQTTVTVGTGLQLLSAPLAFQITPAPARLVTMTPPVVNANTGTPGAPAGGVALVSVANLPASASVTVTVADQRATVVSSANGSMTFQVPSGLPLGPAVVRMQSSSGDSIAPIVMTITPPPPVITSVNMTGGSLIDATHPARPGSTLSLTISGLPDSAQTADSSSVRVTVGGVEQMAIAIAPQSGNTQIQVLLSSSVATGAQVPITVTYAGITSVPALIPIQ